LQAHAPQPQKKRDDAAFERSRQEIAALRAQAQAGEISLAYFDEVGSVMHSSCWCSTTAELFLGFVTELAKTVTKTLVILIDNASIPRVRAIQPALRLLEKKGITLKFLPPYSPELNRIEKLWWLMKHRWMALTRRTKVELEHTVNHILTNFGSEFKMAF
jgi:transposase